MVWMLQPIPTPFPDPIGTAVAVATAVSQRVPAGTLQSDPALELIKALAGPAVTLFIGVIGIYYAQRAAKSASIAAIKADTAVIETQTMATQQTEMNGRLDGKLDELKQLWQKQARAEGKEEGREEGKAEAVRVAEQSKATAVTAREDARRDRAEGAAAGLPTVAPQEVIPVETRTEAAVKEVEHPPTPRENL